MAVRSPQDTYARHVSSSRGYPLWTPDPSSQLISHQREGLMIGDVGVVIPDNGSFDVFFNLCLPKDHPFHQAYGVPEGFNHIELSDADVKTVRNVESAGRVLTTSCVTRVGSDGAPTNLELPPRSDQSDVTRYSFNMSSNEGGVLILPDGADRHDVRNPQPFFEQASRNAAAWYRFAEGKLGRIISHDSIYVITGIHMARSWGLASYQNDDGGGAFPARFTMGREGQVGYSWESTRSMDWRVGPYDGPGDANQSVFIRGFKIALRSSLRGVPQRWVSFQPSPSGRSSRRSSGDSWLSNVWRGISKTIGMSNEGNGWGTGSYVHDDVGVRIEISRIPEILPVFHPLDVINQYVLQKEPSAKVAITHDSVWGSLLDENLLQPETLVQDESMISAVMERFTIALQNDVAYLQSKSGLDTYAGAITNDSPTTDAVQLDHPQALTIVSESNHRCVDVTALKAISSESRSADVHSIPSKFASGSALPESLRRIKIIVISDYICSFCYVGDKIIRDAIEACRDLPVCFDVEFRPFTLMNPSALPAANRNRVIYRNAYVVKKFGKEQAEMKRKALNEFAQIAGVKLADDNIISSTVQAHRLAAKAYQDGGQALQDKFNLFVFDACLVKGANLSDESVLVDAAVSVGLMNKEEAVRFLQSSEYQDRVEKMVEAAKSQGVNGVPFVIIDGKWAVNGLQPPECFIQIFRKLAHLPAPVGDSGKINIEHDSIVQ